MPDIQAFRGLRYDLGHIGSLSDVVAPPYDVIDTELQDLLYKCHPANVVRLILNRDEPGDDEQSNRYTRAARLLKNWRNEGVLQTEPDPAIYVYHQTFDVDGQKLTRRGFMCRVRLESFGRGTIFPHEETPSGPKADRFMLTDQQPLRASDSGQIIDKPNLAGQTTAARVSHTMPQTQKHVGRLGNLLQYLPKIFVPHCFQFQTHKTSICKLPWGF